MSRRPRELVRDLYNKRLTDARFRESQHVVCDPRPDTKRCDVGKYTSIAWGGGEHPHFVDYEAPQHIRGCSEGRSLPPNDFRSGAMPVRPFSHTSLQVAGEDIPNVITGSYLSPTLQGGKHIWNTVTRARMKGACDT